MDRGNKMIEKTPGGRTQNAKMRSGASYGQSGS